MKLTSSLILLLACVVVCSYAQSQSEARCDAATVTVVKRADQYASWMIGSSSYQIYDLQITNNGKCAITTIQPIFSTGGVGFISEAWNYNKTLGDVTGFGTALQPGQSFYGAGLVVCNSSVGLFVIINRAFCDASCVYATTAAPTTSAPTTSAPTTAAPTTAAPTTAAPTTAAPTTVAPTTAAPTTAAPTQGGCRVTAVVIRDSYSWLDNGRNTSVYRLTITNSGPCALKDYVLSFAYYPGTLLSSWNLESALGGYKVTGYGDKLAAGSSYSAAGMVLAGAPDHVDADGYGSNCAC